MIYVDIVKRERTITIDGYSKAKTIRGAISDIGRYIKRHISEREGNAILEYKEQAVISSSKSEGGYFLELEEVGCASKLNDKTGVIEYSDSNWYICCCIVM